MLCMTVYVYLTRENGPRIARLPVLERKAARPVEAGRPPAAPTQGRFE
jgi:hypothetical protein